ncbi:hypothetical protein FHR83_004192 [Actinoplanes campanulatus]|uniref:PH domain-containing protein n=1 Tax=Actinoplanes campanulatus TaxID=113559 RepID=A0A7W5FFM2_9ACTN|nr:hypothetical protein [Actinoplanes campanulatus]MBB3096522.1 hypothetical protein [Actinoplanes campanulatus]GGN17666.1 hypothetical protein GCM10010109_30470 [Actinoplanes campanulatus]GID38589.1 hypothetical protein Aca09nite_50950 [Actinoplanes campanulatus]
MNAYHAAARRPLPALLAALLVAVITGVAVQTVDQPMIWSLLLLGSFLLALVLCVMGILLRDRSGVPLAPTGEMAFETPVSPYATCLAAAHTLMWVPLGISETVGDLVRGELEWPRDVFIALFAALLIVTAWIMALLSRGIRVEAAGVWRRGPWRDQMIRWDELTVPGAITAGGRRWIPAVRLRRASGRTILVPTPHPGRLATILREYAADPGRRAAIGTVAESGRIAR